MATRKHDGRAEAERSQRLTIDPLERQRQRAREADEEARWAALAGPVTVRHKDEDEPCPES